MKTWKLILFENALLILFQFKILLVSGIISGTNTHALISYPDETSLLLGQILMMEQIF